MVFKALAVRASADVVPCPTLGSKRELSMARFVTTDVVGPVPVAELTCVLRLLSCVVMLLHVSEWLCQDGVIYTGG